MSSSAAIFSFFSGCGLLDLGFEDFFDIKFISDVSQSYLKGYVYARKKFQKPEYGMFSGINGDITNLLKQELSTMQYLLEDCKENYKTVGFVGGSPCPDFSVAGKNKGFHGDNGKLTDSFLQLIVQCKPHFFVLENVKGLVSNPKHNLFYEAVKRQFEIAGYTLSENIISALDYGVPQDRKRIILIGFLNDYLQDHSLSIDSLNWRTNALYNSSAFERRCWSITQPFVENSVRECPPNIVKELTAQYWWNKNQVDTHENGKDSFKPRKIQHVLETVDEGDTNRKYYKRLHRWRYSPTVCYGNNEVHLHPYKTRRLSVAESMALQSLPANFTLPPEMSFTDKFKTISNGVPYLAAKAIAGMIDNFIP